MATTTKQAIADIVTAAAVNYVNNNLNLTAVLTEGDIEGILILAHETPSFKQEMARIRSLDNGYMMMIEQVKKTARRVVALEGKQPQIDALVNAVADIEASWNYDYNPLDADAVLPDGWEA